MAFWDFVGYFIPLTLVIFAWLVIWFCVVNGGYDPFTMFDRLSPLIGDSMFVSILTALAKLAADLKTVVVTDPSTYGPVVQDWKDFWALIFPATPAPTPVVPAGAFKAAHAMMQANGPVACCNSAKDASDAIEHFLRSQGFDANNPQAVGKINWGNLLTLIAQLVPFILTLI